MSFKIVLEPKAKKFLDSLPDDIALRIVKKLKSIRNDPFHFLEHFEGGYYKMRIGKYRALVSIDKTERVITIEIIDKRGRIYKR